MSDGKPLGDFIGDDALSAVAARWAALGEAAAIVAALAGASSETELVDIRDFPERLGAACGWRKALAETAVDDLAAVMEPGIAALLAVHQRGVSPAAAAQALWREFVSARAALLALLDADA